MQVSPDGSNWFTATLNTDSTWTYDWDSSQAKDGSYTPLAYAVDNAGNRTDITLQPITLDNSAPAMSMTGSWYIWDSGHIVVYDNRVGIKRIELSVRDDQNRWPAREWEYDTSKLEMDLQWDRKFGDGTIAPTGSYQVLLQAWDKLGNGRWITSRIYIPEAGATAVIPLEGVVSGGTFEDTPTPMAEQTETEANAILPADQEATEPAPTATLQPSSTPSSFNFSSAPIIPASGESKSTSLPVDPNLLTGAAALAAAASATAYSLQRKEEKEAERKRQEAQSKAEANAKVQEAEAIKVANIIALRALEKKYDQKFTSEDIAEHPALKASYQSTVNGLMGYDPNEYSDEEMQEIQNDELQIAAEAKAEFMATNPEIAAFITSQESSKAENAAAAIDKFIAANPVAANFIVTQERTKAENEARAALDNFIATNPEAVAFIASQERIKAENEAYEEYMAKLANEAYLKKMERVEAETEGRNVITPKTTFKEVVANILNSASAGLGKLHDYSEKVKEKTIDWIDKNQTGVAAGVGLGVGVVVVAAAIGIGILLTGAVSIPAILIGTGISILLAGGITYAGTNALNQYYGRDPSTNMVKNLLVTGFTSFLPGLLATLYFSGVLAPIFTAFTGVVNRVCAANPNACVNIGILLDKGEETWLELQLQYQLSTGNPAATWTAIELEIERADNNFPGNSVLMEAFRYVKKYFPDSWKYVDDYGKEILPFLRKYGDEGMTFLDELLEEETEFVIKHINDLDALGLAVEYGKPAMKLIDSVDVADAKKILNALDDVDIDALLKFSDDAIKQLANIDPIELQKISGKLRLISDLGNDGVKYIYNGKIDLSQLTQISNNSWISNGGLIYGPDRNFGNRVNHVLAHTVSDPSKPVHSVFDISNDEIFGLLDEAWQKKGSPLPNDPGTYMVDMGRVIGTNGETTIRIVVIPGTSEIITAYPK